MPLSHILNSGTWFEQEALWYLEDVVYLSSDLGRLLCGAEIILV